MSSPYPGLRPFQQDEAHLFFGREAQIEDMLARLEDHRFLAVVGTSGCGKSSLVRAGLIPALEEGFLSEALPHWRIAVMRPGSEPFDNLTATLLSEAALGPERQGSAQAGALLQATLRRGPLGLSEAVAESQLPEGTNVLLVVDQFEELFRYRTQTKNINDADAFVSLLLASAQPGQSEVPIYVVITMRSDFIGDCALFAGLPEVINDSQFLTPRLTRDQYRAAIEEPALVAGGKLSEALVNRLLNDLRGEPDQLPVLQHALMRMWTQAADNIPARALTVDDYEAVGGLSGALSKHCDEILHADLSTEQQGLAEVMFRALCERSSEQRDTRRPAKLGEIAAIAGVDVEAMIPVVDAFRGAGRDFLMPPWPVSLDAETTLDISHESLIRQWPTLNAWVVAEAESAYQYQRLEDDAKRRQKGMADLWGGVNLETARLWREQQKPTAAWAARYGDAYPLAMEFLNESEAEEGRQRCEREQARRRELKQAQERAEEQATRAAEQARSARLFKAITAVVGGLLLLSALAFIHALRQTDIAVGAQKDVVVHQARYLSAVAQNFVETQPTLSILLSVEALKGAKVNEAAFVPAAEETLRKAISQIAGTALVGHDGPVYGVAFSPDGQVLATASADNTVRLWSLWDASAEPRLLRGHTSRVQSLGFSPDGQLLATASADKTVRLWSLRDAAAEPRLLRGHDGPVYGVAFSPDGQLLATASADNTVRLWSLADTVAAPRVLKGHTGRVFSLAFSPDGQLLATASADKTVRLWSFSDTAESRLLRGHDGPVYGVAFSPDGQVLATASADDTVRLWSVRDAAAEPRLLRGHADTVHGVAFSPDGQLLVTVSADKTARLWSLQDAAAEPRLLRGHASALYGVAFSPDGQQLATASADKTVRLWSLGEMAAEPRLLRGHVNTVFSVASSPDGQLLATASADKTVRLWSLGEMAAEPRLLRVLQGHLATVHGVAFSPDGQLLATASADKTVRLWSSHERSAEPRLLRGHAGMIYGVAFSPDGQLLATASADKTVRLWSVRDAMAEPRLLRGHDGPVYGVAFSPDGQQLATASADKTVRLWSVQDAAAEPRLLRGHDGPVYGVAFSPDGQQLATVSADNTVRLWSLSEMAAEPRLLRGHTDTIHGLAFSPNGQQLATASADKTVRLWSLGEVAAEPRLLRGHVNTVHGVAFSPDGKLLATASADDTVRLWSLVIDDLVRKGCRLTNGNFSHEDWKLYLRDNPYKKTCQERPIHPSFLKSVRAEIKAGDVKGGVGKLYTALYTDGTSDAHLRGLEKEARVLAAPGLVERGQELARAGEVDKAVEAFKQALELDRTLDLEPETEARRLAARALTTSGRELARAGEVDKAVGAFKQARTLDRTLKLEPETEARRLAAITLVDKGQELARVGEVDGAVATFRQALDLDSTLKFEPETEARRLAAPRVVASGRELARAGEVDKAVEAFKQALELDRTLDLEPETEARRLAAITLVDKGQELARVGEVDGAVATFRQALDLDSTLKFEPETEARRLAAPALVDKGRELARQGDIRQAMAQFSAARENDPNLEIDAHSWNSLCWFGSLAGFAPEVLAYCEQAVTLAPDDGGNRDSRGLARALTGDYPGAVEDFRQYLAWGPKNGQPDERIRQRQDWIQTLQANQNPFTAEALKPLWEQ